MGIGEPGHGLWLWLRLSASGRRTTAVSAGEHSEGFCPQARETRAQGQETSPRVLSSGARGAVRRHRCVPRTCPQKRCPGTVPLEGLASPDGLERLVQARGVRTDHEEDAGAQDSRRDRQRSRQDLSGRRGVRRSNEARSGPSLAWLRQSFPEGWLLSRHELRRRFLAPSSQWLAGGPRRFGCGRQGCVFSPRPDDGEVPSELAVLRGTPSFEAAHVSIQSFAAEALSRCAFAFCGESDYCGALSHQVDPDNVHADAPLSLCCTHLGSDRVRRLAGSGSGCPGDSEAAETKVAERRDRGHPRTVEPQRSGRCALWRRDREARAGAAAAFAVSVSAEWCFQVQQPVCGMGAKLPRRCSRLHEGRARDLWRSRGITSRADRGC
mmetsp:Transcript_71319/g.128367  ORF Transcript_71319/g.128367 Transcript_71319/m.128367 type:complete len:381 (-) Transcript_71319:1684-2826(-)